MDRYRSPRRGRGTHESPTPRFDSLALEPDLETGYADDEKPDPRTRYFTDSSKSALSHNQSPDVGFDVGLNPYRGCEHGCIYCLAPDTPVLHADFSWRPIGEVRVGDVLAGFDETPDPGAPPKLLPSRVLGVWGSRKPSVRISTRGGEVRTTAEHRWLLAPENAWSTTRDLRVGSRLWRIDDTHRLELDPVEAIESRGPTDVIDIQTSTGTFFAAGLATHNCFARPSHEYLGFSAGLDFETKIVVKPELPELLRAQLSAKKWTPQVIGISGVTDPYQPIERKLRLTRRCLEVLAEFRNPAAVISKSALIARDVDVFAELARHKAVSVTLSITSLDPDLARAMEPRAAQPKARLAAVSALARAGVPVGVNAAPIIPGLNDHELPALAAAAAEAGAQWFNWLLVRLPHGVKELFDGWLAAHYPERRERVLHRIRETRDGALSSSAFGERHRGTGLYAQQLAALADLSRARHGLAARGPMLSVDAFRPPKGAQLRLL